MRKNVFIGSAAEKPAFNWTRSDSNLDVILLSEEKSLGSSVAKYLSEQEDCKPHVEDLYEVREAVQYLKQKKADVVLYDLGALENRYSKALRALLELGTEIPIVLLIDRRDHQMALNLMQQGAQDYLFKAELGTSFLSRTISNAMERKEIQNSLREQAELSSALAEIGQIAVTEDDVEKVVERSLEVMAEVLDAKYYEGLKFKDDRFYFVAGYSPENHSPGQEVAVIGDDSMASDIVTNYRNSKGFETFEPLRIETLREHEEYRWFDTGPGHEVKSGLSFVISNESRLNPYGLVNFYFSELKTFSQEQLKFIRSAIITLATTVHSHILEEQLKRKVTQLDAANRRKDEFLATLSHELRNPLNVIVGYAELLKNRGLNHSGYQEAVDAILSSAYAESQLVSEVLDVSRIITGKFNLKPSRFCFDSLASSVVSSFRMAANSKGVRLENKLTSKKLGEFVGDKDKIRQVLWNLLSNAIKFTQRGGRVTLKGERVGEAVQFSVEDTGKGIDPRHLPYIFEKFWQEDTSIRRTYSGMGLGLSIVKNIVELHGGRIAVDSKGSGLGAVFTVLLPNQEIEDERNDLDDDPIELDPGQANQMSTKQSRHPNRALFKAKVLAVDDDEVTGVLIRHLLEEEGAIVTVFQDPVEALEAAKSGRFDCMVSDIGMPKLDGYELISRLRTWENQNKRKHLPAVALTAYGGATQANRAIEAGFHAHQEKPLYREQFVRTLSSLID